MATNPEPDYYEILGVEPNASQEEIDKAFRKARRDNHPDKSSTGAWAFRLVEMAYETLKDPDRRSDYDRSQRDGSSKPSGSGSGGSASGGATTPPQPTPEPTQRQSSPAPATSNQTGTTYVPPAEDVITYEQYEKEATNLEKFSFSPDPSQYKLQIFGGLIFSLMGLAGMFLLWFDPLLPKVIALAAAALVIGAIFMSSKRGELEKSAMLAVIFLVMGWVLMGLPLAISAKSPVEKPAYLVSWLAYAMGGLVAMLFMPKFQTIRDLNKRVPVAQLKEYRAYGVEKARTPNEAAVLRNISTTIRPITDAKDGTFLFNLDGLKVENTLYPANAAVLRGNKLAILTYMPGSPGKYGVTTDGNIVRMIGEGMTHVENINPHVLRGCNVIKGRFPDLETKSIVVVVPTSHGNVESYYADSTTVVQRQEALKALLKYFNDDVDFVRRDVIDFLLPSLGSNDAT